MPLIHQLHWAELDLLQGLGTIPEESSDGSFHYKVRHEGLLLLVSLWPDMGVVDVTLAQADTQTVLLDFTVAVRGDIRYNNDRRGEYVEFADCVLVGRVGLTDEQIDASFSPNMLGRTLQLAVKPHISVLFE